MARPASNTVEYFPHYISDGKKMFILEQRFGNDGYATWFKILETLAKTEMHYINMNDSSTIMYLAAKCRVSDDILTAIIELLVQLGELDSQCWNDYKVIWCQKFVDSIADAYRRRSTNLPHKLGLLRQFEGFCRQYDGNNPQSKVEYIKVEETKGEEKRTREDIKAELISIITSREISANDFPVVLLADKFFDHYESTGWKINGVAMVKWQSRLSMWVSEHLADPSRLIKAEKRNAQKLTAAEEEEIDIAILKHARYVQSDQYDPDAPENHRLRGLPKI